jgi:hypothetical protein
MLTQCQALNLPHPKKVEVLIFKKLKAPVGVSEPAPLFIQVFCYQFSQTVFCDSPQK